MQYNAVLNYAGEGQSSYYRYHLTSDPPTCPTAKDEPVRVWGNIFRDDSDSDSDLDESDMFIRHHARCRKHHRRDRNEDGTSDEEPEDESYEEEEKSPE